MRKPSGTDFHVDADYEVRESGKVVRTEPLGRFTFGRRTMRDMFLIRSEYNRLTNGNYTEDGVPVDIGAWAVATLSVLMVATPDSFDLDKIDPLTDDSWEDKTAGVYTALRAKELHFRTGSAKEVQAGSAGTGGQPSVRVPPSVQPSAD